MALEEIFLPYLEITLVRSLKISATFGSYLRNLLL